MSRLVSRPAVVPVAAVALALTVVFAFSLPNPTPGWFAPLRAADALLLLGAVSTPSMTRNGGSLVLALMGWEVTVTFLHGRLSLGILFATAAAVALFALPQKCGRGEGSLRAGLLLFAIITIAINAVSFANPVVDPGGHYFYYVGGKNSLALTFLPLVYLLHVNWRPYRRSLMVVRVGGIVLAVSAVFFAGSGTGKVMVLAYLAFLLHRGRLCRKWAWWFLSIPLIHLSLVSGWLLTSSDWARSFVEAGLGKRADFTDRSAIWEAAWTRVQGQPLGEGRQYSFLTEQFPSISECHNMLLETLIIGGWPGLLMLLGLIGVVMQVSSRREQGGAGVYFLWVAGLIGAMESYTNNFGFWLLLGLVAATPTPVVTSGVDTSVGVDHRLGVGVQG